MNPARLSAKCASTSHPLRGGARQPGDKRQRLTRFSGRGRHPLPLGPEPQPVQTEKGTGGREQPRRRGARVHLGVGARVVHFGDVVEVRIEVFHVLMGEHRGELVGVMVSRPVVYRQDRKGGSSLICCLEEVVVLSLGSRCVGLMNYRGCSNEVAATSRPYIVTS